MSLPSAIQTTLIAEAEAAIELCHRDIAEYHRVISLLSAKRNACTVSYRIPHELLGRIMRFSVEFSAGSASLSALDRVSRHWRTVALGTPMLWSSISVRPETQARVVETLLSRAKAAPLDVFIWSEPQKSPWSDFSTDASRRKRSEPNRAITANVLEHLLQIRSLTLRISSTTVKFLNEKISRCVAAPQLQSMHLHLDHDVDGGSSLSDEGDVDDEDDFHDSEPPIPPTLQLFSKAELPKLRKLRITSSSYQLQKQLALLSAPSITDFALKNSSFDHTDALPPEELKAALRAMPLLKRLSLEGRILLPRPSLSSDDCPIPMPHLRHLLVSECSYLFLWAVDHIQIPPRTEVRLFARHDPNSGLGSDFEVPAFRRLGQRITSLLRARGWVAGARPTAEVSVWPAKKSLREEYELWFWPSYADSDLEETERGSVAISISHSRSHMQGHYMHLIGALPLDEVRDLNIFGDTNISKYANLASWPVYRHLIGRMDSVQLLCFVSWTPEHLAHTNMLLWPGQSEGEFVLPCLAQLDFRDMPFGAVDVEPNWGYRMERMRVG